MGADERHVLPHHGRADAGPERDRAAERADRARQQHADDLRHGVSRRKDPQARAGSRRDRFPEQALRRRAPDRAPRDRASKAQARRRRTIRWRRHGACPGWNRTALIMPGPRPVVTGAKPTYRADSLFDITAAPTYNSGRAPIRSSWSTLAHTGGDPWKRRLICAA